MTAVGSNMVPLGSPAPPFALPDPIGSIHRLPEPGTAPAVVVMFLCNHCPYVRHIAPRLGELAASWSGAGVEVLGINSNDVDAYPADSPDLMGPTADEFGWDFAYLFDEDQSVARSYSAACTPDFFVYDSQLRLVYRGRFDASRPSTDTPVTGGDLNAAVQAVLSHQSIDTDQFASIGCNIKWRNP